MYTALVIVAGVLSLFLTPPRDNKKDTLYYWGYYGIWAIVFITIAFRAEQIGTDTINYLNKYESIVESPSYVLYGGTGSIEPLFYYLNKVLALLFGDWSYSIIMIEALFVSFCYGEVFKKYSLNPILSILAFMSFGLYLSSLCLVRQFIAMSVCVISLKYVFERKFISFIVCVLIATAFHYTAFFWGIVYLVCILLTRYKNADWIFIILALISYYFVDVFQAASSLLTDRWNQYSEIETGAGGFLSFLMFFLITLLSYLNRLTIKNKYQYGHELLALNYINMVFWTMRLATRNAERISFFFIIAPILMVPILCDIISYKYGKSTGAIFKGVVVFLMSFLFIYKYSRDASVYPFQFMSF